MFEKKDYKRMYEKDLAQSVIQTKEEYRHDKVNTVISTVRNSVSYIKGRNTSNACTGRKLNEGY
jgi:hypothetical protein